MDNNLMENVHVQADKANYDWLMQSKAQLEAGVPFDKIQETIYLNSIHGMAESIIDGANTSIDDCVPEDMVEW